MSEGWIGIARESGGAPTRFFPVAAANVERRRLNMAELRRRLNMAELREMAPHPYRGRHVVVDDDCTVHTLDNGACVDDLMREDGPWLDE